MAVQEGCRRRDVDVAKVQKVLRRQEEYLGDQPLAVGGQRSAFGLLVEDGVPSGEPFAAHYSRDGLFFESEGLTLEPVSHIVLVVKFREVLEQ